MKTHLPFNITSANPKKILREKVRGTRSVEGNDGKIVLDMAQEAYRVVVCLYRKNPAAAHTKNQSSLHHHQSDRAVSHRGIMTILFFPFHGSPPLSPGPQPHPVRGFGFSRRLTHLLLPPLLQSQQQRTSSRRSPRSRGPARQALVPFPSPHLPPPTRRAARIRRPRSAAGARGRFAPRMLG
jgi:hypothetical protein